MVATESNRLTTFLVGENVEDDERLGISPAASDLREARRLRDDASVDMMALSK